MPTTRAQSRHQNTTNHFDFNSPLKIRSEVGLGDRQHSPGLAKSSFPTIECASALLALPTETRLQIYECLLLPALYGDGEGQASAKRGGLFDGSRLYNGPGNGPFDVVDENSNGLTYGALRKEERTRNHATSERPSRESRKTYSQLLLVCKTIHYEAAPLFFSKATFFIREPFHFANNFLRNLALDKIYSLRSLELRMTLLDVRIRQYGWPSPKNRVLYNLHKLFETYHRELGGLESVFLTLVVKGSISPANRESDIIFRPLETHSLAWWTRLSLDWTREAERALVKIMKVSQSTLSNTVEEVYERAPNDEYVALRGTVARVKLQRMK
jgi:hypothetical protein